MINSTFSSLPGYKVDFPKLMATESIIVIMVEPRRGTVVAYRGNPREDKKIGEEYNDWYMGAFSDYTGCLTLQNKFYK